MNEMPTILIDNVDFTNMEAQKYYSFSSTYKGNKQQKALELCNSGEYYGSRKMDGAWNLIIKDMKGKFHMRSRKPGVNGTFIDKAEWVPQIISELSYLPNGTALVGEIYFPDNEGSRKVTTVLNCLKEKCLERQEKGEKLHFYVFDVVAWNGLSWISCPFIDRISKISTDVKETTYVHVAQYCCGSEVWELYNEVIAQGGEGIVITKQDAKYMCGKRTAWLTLKLKKEMREPIDAFVDGAYTAPARLYTGKNIETWPYWINLKTGQMYGENQFEAYVNGMPVEPVTESYYFRRAGSISFSVYDGTEPRHIAWISGLPNQIKEEIISAPEKWVGKVAQLTGMQIEEIDGKYSFRHGKIETWRDDKAAEDCLYSQITN